MRFEDIDLQEVASKLKQRVQDHAVEGYLRGKAVLRDLVRDMMSCSDVEAEDLIDTLELHGYLRYSGDPSARSQAHAPWNVNPSVES